MSTRILKKVIEPEKNIRTTRGEAIKRHLEIFGKPKAELLDKFEADYSIFKLKDKKDKAKQLEFVSGDVYGC
jgi:hypothetical protein